MQKFDAVRALAAVEETMREAGQRLAKHYGNVEHRAKSDNVWDHVTKLDLETESFLDRELEKFNPSIGFAGEEHGVTRKGEQFWLVDPIDGTGHFIRGMPFCTIMLSLIDKGRVELGAIHNFVNQEFFSARRGGGAFCNGTAISVSQRDLHNGFIHAEINVEVGKNLEVYKQLNRRCNIMDTYNCGWDFSMIASGKMEGRIVKDGWGQDWDYAAGSLLVSEAGGKVTNLDQS